MKTQLFKTALLCSAILLAACSDDDDNTTSDTADKPTMEFEVTLSNITQGQIFSPPILVTHDNSASLWQVGSPSSVALEYLAEGGSTSQTANLSIVEQSYAKEAPVKPGMSTSWTIMLDAEQKKSFSLATMLIHTNDGFTGLTGYDLSNMTVNSVMSKMLGVYDAGTEANDEMQMPGAGNEGFNVSRENDVDRVYMHAGVLTEADLSTSVLQAEHKFDNPVAKLVIKRLQ
ncbi:hypothetical protein C2869_14800 [Saccharobesus litoralis]|uniref:Spondin domain-containing protein n=1 Tax=Saccharobesus litoralis TaxID=2172099 RepID=A0A2S0VTT3_9ALTE|nr:spondin domain-containing protein [Saccharobesus litoralis]AWB67628.1 hypothetical protein C2869_14800 [Saccharobesus litoralis]